MLLKVVNIAQLKILLLDTFFRKKHLFTATLFAFNRLILCCTIIKLLNLEKMGEKP